MVLEGRLHNASLDADATSVDQAQFAKSGGVRCPNEFVDYRRDVAWGKGVKVELGLDRDDVRLCHACLCSATTVVAMPPRTVNAPVTVIRLGWHAATRSSRILLVTAS